MTSVQLAVFLGLILVPQYCLSSLIPIPCSICTLSCTGLVRPVAVVLVITLGLVSPHDETQLCTEDGPRSVAVHSRSGQTGKNRRRWQPAEEDVRVE